MINSFEDFIHGVLHEAIEFGKSEESESGVETEDFVLKKINEIMAREKTYRENIN